MPFRDFNNLSLASTLYGVVAAAGGFVADYFRRVKSGQPFQFWWFLIELVISVFVGLLMFSIAETLHQPPAFCAAIAAVGGNLGTRVFDFVSLIVSSRIKKETGEDVDLKK